MAEASIADAMIHFPVVLLREMGGIAKSLIEYDTI
jgi:hypothetical protein